MPPVNNLCFDTNVSTNADAQVSPSTKSPGITIQLVNARNTSRPFLHELWNPRIAAPLPNFEQKINQTPFQKNCQLN